MQPTPELEIRIICLNMGKLVFVKDVDLEAMPTSIFLSDDDYLSSSLRSPVPDRH